MAKIKSHINVLGGYKDFDTIPLLIANGKLDLVERTEESSGRYERAIRKTFLTFDSEEHRNLFLHAMSSKTLSFEVKLRILALQFFTVDQLFKILFKDCFLKIVENGRAVVTKHDIIAFLKEKINLEDLDINWSDATIVTVSRKFLTILKKLGYVDGNAKKRVLNVYNDPDFLSFFHYWLIASNDASNVLKSEYFPILMISKEKYLFLMKQDEMCKQIDWQYTGSRFTIEPKLSIYEYVNEL